MEGLIELVAASFVRHGIESPVDSTAVSALPAETADTISQILPSELPEHSYRKKPDGDFAL
jgi:hypothetical protein